MSENHPRLNVPATEWQHFFAVMTESYLTLKADLTAKKGKADLPSRMSGPVVEPIATFDALFAQLELARTEENLYAIIKSQKLLDCAHYFAAEVGRVFKHCTGGSDYVQIWSVGTGRTWRRRYTDFFDTKDFFELLNHEEHTGCFQILDARHNWYGFLDHTLPIVYFAVNDEIAAQLIKYAAPTAMPLSPNFGEEDELTVKQCFEHKWHTGISTTVYSVEIRNKHIVLLDILSVIEGAAAFSWTIRDLSVLWKPNMREAAATLPKGPLTLDELKALARRWHQELNAVFTGNRCSETKADDEQGYKPYDVFIEVTGRSLWRIDTPDKSQVERLLVAYKEATKLPELEYLV